MKTLVEKEFYGYGRISVIILFPIFLAGVLGACRELKTTQVVEVNNSSNYDRTFETVELSLERLKIDEPKKIGVKEVSSGIIQLTQLVDEDNDGVYDVLLFQPQVPKNSTKKYEIISIENGGVHKGDTLCYSRFVPERTDDYAWENDKVAFRVFGPTAQKMVENGVPGGTLSSGVDAWLKRVDYPIIDFWYKKELETEGTYHKDTGQGLDNFHVGASRGVGGMAIKKGTRYYFSKNFINWRTIANGPLRTSFFLEYEDWDAGGNLIKETKIISLDKGRHLSKYEVYLEGTNTASVGLTLHEKDGRVTVDEKNGWVSYWKPHGDSELGTAVIAEPGYYFGSEEYTVPEKDMSNAYMHLGIKKEKTVYYAGFGWKQQGDFTSEKEWTSYLQGFAMMLKEPLQINVHEKR